MVERTAAQFEHGIAGQPRHPAVHPLLELLRCAVDDALAVAVYPILFGVHFRMRIAERWALARVSGQKTFN